MTKEAVTPNSTLAEALRKREIAIWATIDRLRDKHEIESDDLHLLREGVELVRCLRRIVGECSADEIHRAFGAPGDFGYETPIGDALARVYGVRT